jgi:hypothetical protein
MTCRLEFKVQDCWVGVYWEPKTVSVACRDPNCGDSSWDHACSAGSRQELHAWFILLPMVPLHVTWEVKRGQWYVDQSASKDWGVYHPSRMTIGRLEWALIVRKDRGAAQWWADKLNLLPRWMTRPLLTRGGGLRRTG